MFKASQKSNRLGGWLKLIVPVKDNGGRVDGTEVMIIMVGNRI